MTKESLLLKWSFYNQNVSYILHEEATENYYTDVTLVSDDLKTFNAHKFVLSANSSMMKELLLNNPHPTPLIYLKGVMAQELECILQLMYYGKAAFCTIRTAMLINAIEEFQLKGFDLSKLLSKMYFKEDEIEKKVQKRREQRKVVDAEQKSEDCDLFSCEYCDYKALSRKDCRKHVESIHEGIRYECSQCDYRATNKSNLYRHQRRNH